MKKLSLGFILFCSIIQNSHATELSCTKDYTDIISPDLLAIAEELKHNRYDILKQKTHASLIEFSGGEQAYAEVLNLAQSILNSANMEITHVKLQPPLYSYKVDNEEICFIPKQITMKLAGHEIEAPQSFFIAVRSLENHTWTYLDGSGVEKNPHLLFTLFPHFPKNVELPFQPVAE